MSIKEALRSKNLKQMISESWAMSWPMTVIMFCTLLIGLADVYVAGKFGKEIQAAYGFVFQVFFIFSIVGTALTIGAVSLISRLFTSSRKEELHAVVDTSLIAVGIAGILCAFIGIFFSSLAVQVMRLPVVLREPASILLKIYSAGLIGNAILVNTNGVLRACRMIRRSLATMAIVCVLNVFLNFFLAFQTPLGFSGIGVATVISTIVGSVLNIFFIRKLLAGRPRFSSAAFKNIVVIGWPAGVLQVVWQAGSMILFMILANLPVHPVEIMAAFTNGLRIESIIFLPAFAFNMSNAVVVGNLLGKKDKEAAFHGGIVTALMGVAIVTIMTLIVMVNARHIAAMLSDNPVVVRESIRYIYISLISEPFLAWGVILAGGLNGAGDTKSVMRSVIVSVWVFKVPLSYVLGIIAGWGVTAVWWMMNLAVVVQAVLIGRQYFKKRWLAEGAQTFTFD